MAHLTYNPTNGHLAWHSASGHLCFKNVKNEVLELFSSSKCCIRLSGNIYNWTDYTELSPVSLLIPGKQAKTFNDWRIGAIPSSWDNGLWYAGRWTTRYSPDSGQPWRNWFKFAIGAVFFNISSLANRELIGLRLIPDFSLHNELEFNCASNCFHQSFEIAVANDSGAGLRIQDYSIQDALDTGIVVGRVVNYDVVDGVFPFNITTVNTDSFGDHIIVFVRLTNYLDDNQCYLDHDECADGYPAIGGNYIYVHPAGGMSLQHRAGP